MDPLVAFRLGTGAMDAASGDNRDVGTFAYDEFIIDRVVKARLAKNDRNVDGFVDGSGCYLNGNPIDLFTGFDVDIGRGSAREQFAVFCDVVGAMGDLFQLRHGPEQVLI